MKPRTQYLMILLAAVLLGGVLLGSRSAGAVFARTQGPTKSGPYWTNWHGAGPGLPVNLVAKAGINAPGAAADAQAAPVTPPPVPAADAAAPYQVDTAPSITVERIEAVLQQYGSPAVGTGQAFYDLGVKYGINPAVALAFFIHESSCGTKGVARFTKSIGNIRTTPGYRDYQGYRAYDSWEQGIEDYYKLIRDLYIDGWGLHTLAQILPRYAPPADNNDTGAYIQNVQKLMDSWR
jgi:flagellum-specific peptidoglycan hydrolase FlgJ